MPGSHNHYKDKGFSRGYVSTGHTLQALREMGENVLTAAKAALAEGADEIVEEAKGRCPVKTGALRDSIHAVSNKNGTAIKITAAATNKGFFYGQIVEFSPKISRPFLYPAFDAKKDEVHQKIVDAIREAVHK